MPLRHARRLVAAAALCAAAFLTQSSPVVANDQERPIDRLVGQRIANFTLTDAVTGQRIKLYGYRGKKAVVVVFTGTDCPIGDLYLPRLVTLNEKYQDQGVVVLAINANASEPREQVAQHAKEFGLTFPVLTDPSGRVARLLEAERTCEALVIDGTAQLRYRGAIDDQYGYGTRKEEPGRHYVVEAIDAILAGKPVETTATTVMGCPIEQVETTVTNRPRVRPAPQEVIAALKAIDPSRRSRRGRPGQLRRARRPDPPPEVRIVPPTGPGRPLRLADVRRRQALGEVVPRGTSKTSGCPPGTPTPASATSPTTAACAPAIGLS